MLSDTLLNDGIFNGDYDDEDVGAVAHFNNTNSTITISPIPTLRIHKDHPKGQILGDPTSVVQTRGKIQKASSAQQALDFASVQTTEVWVLVDLPIWEKVIGTTWSSGIKDEEKVIVVKTKTTACSIKSLRQEEVKQQPDGIFISQDKYVADILKKFDFLSIRTATTPIESNKPLVKDEDGVDVDVHVYRSMIGSLMYLTASRPDIMFAVCACARFQVTPKASHLNAVKRIFRYLKHQPKLGLWYPRDSPFELEAYSDSDYGGASLDRKSTTGGCQFLGRRLISWQCKKQTIVANSTTEAEYVAAANCCGQVLWIQNQMMDYGFNFMNTKIHIDNESTISVIKNPVAHSRTKHIEIRFHFIRDCYEKRLIEVIKIHTDSNVADLLTKGFDVTRFNFLVVSIGLYLGSRESLERDMDGTEEFLLSNLFDFWLTKVSTDRLKVSTDRQSLYRYKAVRENTGRGLDNQLKDVPVPLDHFPVPTLTKKVLTFMVKKGKNFSGKVTPLFDSMLVQQTEDEGEASERPSDTQTIPSPPHPSEDQPQTQPNPSTRPSPSIDIPDSNPEGFGGNHRGQSSNDTSLSGNEDGLTLQSVLNCKKSTESRAKQRYREESKAQWLKGTINTGLDAIEEYNTGIEEVNTAGLEEAIKLQAQMDEEVARQIHLDEMKIGVAIRASSSVIAYAEVDKKMCWDKKDLAYEQDFAKEMVIANGTGKRELKYQSDSSDSLLKTIRLSMHLVTTMKHLLVHSKWLMIASTPIETNKALIKDEEAKNVDVHLYRSMIGSLMYLNKLLDQTLMFADLCLCKKIADYSSQNSYTEAESVAAVPTALWSGVMDLE
ncbi:hypothetical protein Tco_1045194 [Tanacetum coccineum]|uniref:Uncharacterized protein n=1 Tax=Tanacetum coccineum TaxID=301880 RepID=A0ABQ5GT44_9ASTR